MQEDIQACERFLSILDWLLGLQERHPESLQFGLVHICFANKEALGSAYGANTASKLLVDLAHQLRLAFRKTDLVARILTDFWVLIPYTSPDTVISKVAKIVEIGASNGLQIVDRDISIFSLPNPDLVQTSFASASDFLDRLKAGRQVAMRWGPVTGAV